MKTFFKLLPFLFILTCLPVAISCSDDEQDGKIGNETILGRWVLIHEYERVSCPEEEPYIYEEDYKVSDEREILTFKKNGTVEYDDGSSLSWTITGNTLKLSEKGNSISMTVSKLTSSEMTMSYKISDKDGCELESKGTYQRI